MKMSAVSVQIIVQEQQKQVPVVENDAKALLTIN